MLFIHGEVLRFLLQEMEDNLVVIIAKIKENLQKIRQYRKAVFLSYYI